MLAELPACISIIVCDEIYRLEGGKLLLVGTFNAIAVRKLPAEVPRLAVLYTLTSGRGDVPVTLRITPADEDHPPAFEATESARFADPLEVHEAAAYIRGFQLNTAGKYWVELRAGGQILAQRPLFVNLVPPADR